MTSATFKSLYGNATNKTSQIVPNQEEVEIKIICLISLLYLSLLEGFLGWFEAFWARN